MVKQRSGPSVSQYFGVAGEQDMGFWLGQRGFSIVYGPGGAGGKSAFEKGIDAIAVPTDPKVGLELLILDNKASGLTEPISKCSAFTDDPVTKLEQRVKAIVAGPDFPQKDPVLEKLGELIKTIKSGGGYVRGVRYVLMNANGFDSGPTDAFQAEFYEATKLTDSAAKPLKVEFFDTATPSELEARNKLIEETRLLYSPTGTGNPRGRIMPLVRQHPPQRYEHADLNHQSKTLWQE